MNTKQCFFSSVIIMSGLFLSGPTRFVSAAVPEIILSEIQIIGDDEKDEFIELYNPGTKHISLKNYKLVRRTKTGIINSSLKSSFKEDDIIPSKSFYLITNKNASIGISSLKDADFISGATLTPDNSLAILDTKNVVIDALTWGSEHVAPLDTSTPQSNPSKNRSLVRNRETLAWSLSDIPTPTNSHGETYPKKEPVLPDVPAIVPKSPILSDPSPILNPTPVPLTNPTSVPVPAKIVHIRLNEIFPNPKEKSDTGEFIELYNFGTEPADISGWILHDATKTGKYIFPPGTTLKASNYLSVTDRSFAFSLNNSNETISLYNAIETLVDSLRYETTKEDVSLNYSPDGWRGGTPTPGTENILNHLPVTQEKVPKKGYRGMAITFHAKGKDADSNTLRYVWDFGDGHKSYKRETAHIYEKNGTYTVTLKTTDGQDDVVETFVLKITSYKPPEINITSLIPNPSGKDTENEWITLENREKKEVHLKGFSIATGWKKLVNHPIHKDLVIGPKQSIRLTHAAAAFTLPNQKGRIELRAPDGKVLQAIKYTFEKQIPDDTLYLKKKGARWKFEAPKIQKSDQVLLDDSVDQTATAEEYGSVPHTETPDTETKKVPAEQHNQQERAINEQLSSQTNPFLKTLFQSETPTTLNYDLGLCLPLMIASIPAYATETASSIKNEGSQKDTNDTMLVSINSTLNHWLNKL